MADAADFAILPFFDGPDLRWFLMTEVGGLHVIGGLTPFKRFFAFLPFPPCVFQPMVIFFLGIVGYRFLFLLSLPGPIILDWVNRLQRGGKIFINRVGLFGLGTYFLNRCHEKECT